MIVALLSSGFFETEPIIIQGKLIRPIDFTSRVLIKEWKLGEDEKELTVLQVILYGRSEGQSKRVAYHLLDRYDEVTGLSSMSRTTGFTCTATAKLLIKGLFKEKGVLLRKV